MKRVVLWFSPKTTRSYASLQTSLVLSALASWSVTPLLSGKFLLKSQIPHGDASVSPKEIAPLLLAPVLTVQLAIADSLRDVGAPDVGGVVR